jgi:hypothetical protein
MRIGGLNMGTTTEWLQVLSQGGFFFALMASWDAYNRYSSGRKPALRFEDLFASSVGGLGFGMAITFHWNLFHRPLIFVTVLALAGVFFVGWSRRRARRRRNPVS